MSGYSPQKSATDIMQQNRMEIEKSSPKRVHPNGKVDVSGYYIITPIIRLYHQAGPVALYEHLTSRASLSDISEITE